MHAPLLSRIDALRGEDGEQLLARERVASAQSGDDGPLDRHELLLAETELTMPRRRLTQLPFPRDAENPAEVTRRQDVQGSALGPAADERPPVEQRIHGTPPRRPRRPCGERPSPGEELLALHGEHMVCRRAHR